uniref:Uncharacterized protein n=1 Tax=Arundo donax TaxID=35708 RepID=A0A0A9F4L5_ARUDO
MSNIVNLVLINEFLSEDPGSIRNDLINPLAVAQGLVSLVLSHDGLAFVSVGEVVVAASDEQIGVGEQLLGLLEGAGVAEVEEIEDTVGVDAHGAVLDIPGGRGGRLGSGGGAPLNLIRGGRGRGGGLALAFLGTRDARHVSLCSLSSLVAWWRFLA